MNMKKTLRIYPNPSILLTIIEFLRLCFTDIYGLSVIAYFEYLKMTIQIYCSTLFRREAQKVSSSQEFWPKHPELTIEKSIRFFLFEIKRVFVYNSTVFRLTDLFIQYSFIRNLYANKKVFKIIKLCERGHIVIESHSFLKYWQNR